MNENVLVNDLSHLRFDQPVEARALRCTFEKASSSQYSGVGVWEWEVYTSVDKSALEAKIAEAEALKEKEGSYTKESWTDLMKALDAARATAADADASQAEVDAAEKDLLGAIDGLKPGGDKSELQSMADKAGEILAKRDQYVASSLEGLEDATAAAAFVLADGDALQNQIDEVLDALKKEILKARLLGDVNKDGIVDAADGADVAPEIKQLSLEVGKADEPTTTPASGGGPKHPKTGDETNVVVPVAVCGTALAGIAVFAVWKKKKRS